jgi:hypothetical protein
MKTFTKAFAIVLFSLPLIASAAGKTASASMQVSFEVKESCNVQSSSTAASAPATSSAAKAAPAVACQLNTPYQMTRNADQAAATTSRDAQAVAIRQQAASGEWTITF